MFTLLMVLTALAVVALVGVLFYFLHHIIDVLDRIGGSPRSYLAKLRLGLRAIERETGHLPDKVTQLNEALDAVAGGLKSVSTSLEGTIDAVQKQDLP